MLKMIKILMLIFAANIYSQQLDSLSFSSPKVDSSVSSQPNVIILTQPQIPISDSKPSLSMSNEKEIPGFKEEILNNLDINLGTIFYILIVFLLSYFLTKLITLSRRFDIYKKYPILNSLQIYLKIALWIFSFYLIVASLASQVSLILLILILASLTIFSVASIKFLQNIIGGLYLNITNPFQKGDFIRINEYEGEVQKIELRTTTVLSETNSNISIPNSIFLYVPVINVNRGQVEKLLTINYEFPFEYTPNKIIKVLYEAALSSPYTYSKIKPKVFYTKSDYKKQMRVFQVQVFVFDGKYENELIHNLNLMVAKSLDSLFGKQR